jgi:hypothetical protein
MISQRLEHFSVMKRKYRWSFALFRASGTEGAPWLASFRIAWLASHGLQRTAALPRRMNAGQAFMQGACPLIPAPTTQADVHAA